MTSSIAPETEPMLDEPEKYCSECAKIQASDPLRHFKGCSQRVEREDSHQTMIEEYHSLRREAEVLREELRKALNREKVLNENLTSVQARCTELLKETRDTSQLGELANEGRRGQD